MDKKQVVGRERVEIIVNLIAAAIFLITGLTLRLLQVNFNSKGVIASSFIPIGMALAAYYKIWAIRKYPQQMRPMIISLQDERLTAARNQADAITYAILQWLLKLSFIFYTLTVPDDIFASVGWWIVFALFFISVFAPLIALKYTSQDGIKTGD